MIHIITNHHKTIKWLDLQSKYLKENTVHNYKVYCGISEMPKELNLDELCAGNTALKEYNFDSLESVKNNHAYKMNYLSGLIDVAEEKENDLLVFLDPDAFPVHRGWDDFITKCLKEYPAVAISREENIEPLLTDDQKPYPHASFFATTLGFWKNNNLSWDLDPAQGASCAGVLLKKWFDESGHKWARLLRTNCFNLHPLNYGIYGDLIYHHGSGNRPIYDSVDIWARPELSRKYGVSLDLYHPELLKFNQKISDIVFEGIKNDPRFIRVYFAGRE